MDDAAACLSELGFTALEADVYVFLLQESPATGYRVARALGKPTANVYKALETLEQKGAVLVDEGTSRLVRAIAPQELLAQLDRQFSRRRGELSEALSRFDQPSVDHRLYALRSHDQVYERARAMLARCEKIAIFDLFPQPFAALRPDIEAAVARGVSVFLEIYEPAEVPGAEISVAWTPEQTLERWPGDALHGVIDAREWILALLAKDEPRVLQAVWSASRFLATTQFTCLAADFMQARMRRWIELGLDGAETEKRLSIYDALRLRHAPGFQEFRTLVGRGIEETPTPKEIPT